MDGLFNPSVIKTIYQLVSLDALAENLDRWGADEIIILSIGQIKT